MITLLASSLHPILSPHTITWWWHLAVRTKHFQHCCIFFHKEGRQRLLFSPALGHPGHLQDCRCSRRSEQNAPFEVRSAWNCQASNQWPGRLWTKFHIGIHRSQVQTHPFLELGGILLQRHLVLETEVERFLISGRMFCAIDSYPI